MLLVGDDWAEDHRDVEVVDESGRKLAWRRFPDGVTGMAGLHALIADHLPDDAEASDVVVGIETDRGPWVTALIAAGYQGVCDQSDAGVPLSGSVLDLGRETRSW